MNDDHEQQRASKVRPLYNDTIPLGGKRLTNRTGNKMFIKLSNSLAEFKMMSNSGENEVLKTL